MQITEFSTNRSCKCFTIKDICILSFLNSPMPLDIFWVFECQYGYGFNLKWRLYVRMGVKIHILKWQLDTGSKITKLLKWVLKRKVSGSVMCSRAAQLGCVAQASFLLDFLSFITGKDANIEWSQNHGLSVNDHLYLACSNLANCNFRGTKPKPGWGER